VDSLPRRLQLASRLLFVLSGPLIGAGVVCVIGGFLAAKDVATRLLERLLAEIDAETLAGLPPDFLTPSTVQRAAFAVVGSLFVAFTAGGTAVFSLAATSAQPQAALLLTMGAIGLGAVAALYATIAALTGAGRRELEASTG
jgi:hypothetical protein